jgi:hypothetical protein
MKMHGLTNPKNVMKSKDTGLVGRDALLLGECFPTFRREFGTTLRMTTRHLLKALNLHSTAGKASNLA